KIETIRDEDRHLAPWQFAQAAHDEIERAERAERKIVVGEILHAGVRLLRRIIRIIVGIRAEARHHIPALGIPGQLFNRSVKNAAITSELLQRAETLACPNDADQIAILHLLIYEFFDRLARIMHARKR